MPIKYVWNSFAPIRHPGRGLYTSGDTQRGQVPTPSEARRGLSASDPTSRWFALDQGTKDAWTSAAQFGMSGRQAYTAVNQMLLGAQQPSTDTPPPGPYQPSGNTISNFFASLSYFGIGNPAYGFDYDDGAPDQWVEFATYKAATGIPGTSGTGARWLLVSSLPLSYIGQSGNLSTMLGGIRGPNDVFHWVPVPAAGTAIRVRAIVTSSTFWPGQPQYFDTVVSP